MCYCVRHWLSAAPLQLTWLGGEGWRYLRHLSVRKAVCVGWVVDWLAEHQAVHALIGWQTY